MNIITRGIAEYLAGNKLEPKCKPMSCPGLLDSADLLEAAKGLVFNANRKAYIDGFNEGKTEGYAEGFYASIELPNADRKVLARAIRKIIEEREAWS